MSFKSVILYLLLFAISLPLLGNKKEKKPFKLRPSISGDQTGWFDAEGLPTSIKINDEWVLPRGGTMEWLMTKGYVPDSEDKNIMRPNPFDSRYKKAGPKYLPSLATSPLEYIYVPRAKKSNDPFAGLAEPMKKKYTPIPGIGSKTLDDKPQNPGPILDPDLPKLDNSPFAEPPLPINEAKEAIPFIKNGRLPANDPFADDISNPANDLEIDFDKLPGKKIVIP